VPVYGPSHCPSTASLPPFILWTLSDFTRQRNQGEPVFTTILAVAIRSAPHVRRLLGERLGLRAPEGAQLVLGQSAVNVVCDQSGKRYSSASIGRSDVPTFVGSLLGLGVTKGVFVTTSTDKGFVEAARALGYAVTDEKEFLREQQKRVFDWAAFTSVAPEDQFLKGVRRSARREYSSSIAVSVGV